MKLLTIYLILLLWFQPELKSYQFSVKNHEPVFMQDQQVVSQHLQMMFDDLIQKNILTSKKILVLDCYPSLVGLQKNLGEYSFEAVGKPELNISEGNTLVFWRMDLFEEKAHYEFFLGTSTQNSVRLEYFFEYVNNQWQLKR